MLGRIQITKAKLDKDGKLSVSYSESTTDGVGTVNEKSPAFPHPDLIAAFRALSPHLAGICEQRNKEGELSEKVILRSYSLKIEEDNEGFVLSGLRIIADGKMFALNTPFMRWERDKPNYAEMKELQAAITHCNDEIYLHLFEEKHGVNPQGELFPVQDQETELDEKEVKIPATPINVINEMISFATIEADMSVLVPCARNGEVVKSILMSDPAVKVNCFDLLKDSDQVLTKDEMKNISLPDGEFLKYKPLSLYDRVVGQPFPRQDANYIYHMHKCLNPGGRMVAVILASVLFENGKDNDKLNQWLEKVEAIKKPLDNGAFDEKGNAVKTVMIIVDRPAKKGSK